MISRDYKFVRVVLDFRYFGDLTGDTRRARLSASTCSAHQGGTIGGACCMMANDLQELDKFLSEVGLGGLCSKFAELCYAPIIICL